MSSVRNPMEWVREDIRQLTYKGVESLDAIAREVGLPVAELVKLDANENVYGADASVLAAMVESLQPRAHVYPDPVQLATRQAIFGWLSRAYPAACSASDDALLSIDNVVAGAGSDDVLDMAIRLLSPKTIVVSTPTFGMYKFLGELVGARVVDVPRRAPSFDVDVDAVVAAVREHNASMVFLPSPNNPTGNCLLLSEVRRLCDSCAAMIVIDEAYAEFAFDVAHEHPELLPPPPPSSSSSPPSADDFGSAIPLLPLHANLAVTRTFSKWAGLAGLRVGFLLSGCRALVAGLLAIKQPYNISATAEAGACAALAARGQIMRSVAALCQERDRLLALLGCFAAWLRPLPSHANFVLCEVRPQPTGITALAAYQHLRRHGVLVRYFGTQGGALTSYFRVSAGTPAHTDRLVAVLRSLELQHLPPGQRLAGLPSSWWPVDALLFDMDGVLADVGDSYRRAIVDTAAHFYPRRPVTADDIEQAKQAGNANNDWLVTHDLIARFKAADSDDHSPAPSFEQVRDKFEQLYQGGLYKNESLLFAPALLDELRSVVPLAIVTGRPRQPDAVRFLADHAVDAFFADRLVCMEDAPLKPSPEPVLLALRSLVEHTGRPMLRAAMIGDTVDDVVAAAKAGVLPIGVLPPRAKNPDQAVDALYRAGAYLVYRSTHDLQQALADFIQAKRQQ